MHDSTKGTVEEPCIQFKNDMIRLVFCGARNSGKSTLLMNLIKDIKIMSRDEDSDESVSKVQNSDDLTWHYFSAPRRKYVVADIPGVDTQLNNLVTAASIADVAVIITDANKGVQPQTKHQTYLAKLMGIRNFIHVVTKMDLCNFKQEDFNVVCKDLMNFASSIDLFDITSIPVSTKSQAYLSTLPNGLCWYEGPSLCEVLESIDTNFLKSSSFRMAVQQVYTSNESHQLLRGTVVSGIISVGSEVRIEPGRQTSKIKQILGPNGSLEKASSGQSISLELADDQEVVRGNMLGDPLTPPTVSDQFAAYIVWLDEYPMIPGRNYELRMPTVQASAWVTELNHIIDIDTLETLPAEELSCNQIGYCNLSTDRDLAFDSYNDNRFTGSFLIIDKQSNNTSGVGVINYPLDKSANLTWQHMSINKRERSLALKQNPMVLWFTGLSGAGKTTVADRLEKKLHAMGIHTYLIDGDNVRHGLNRDLGFTQGDRVENVRRVAELARLMVDAGLVVIVTLISPFRAEREMARELLESGEFIEIHVSTPLQVCQQRDPKGLYKKALKGELLNLTGIDSSYEEPLAPDIKIDCTVDNPDSLAEHILAFLASREQ